MNLNLSKNRYKHRVNALQSRNRPCDNYTALGNWHSAFKVTLTWLPGTIRAIKSPHCRQNIELCVRKIFTLVISNLTVISSLNVLVYIFIKRGENCAVSC